MGNPEYVPPTETREHKIAVVLANNGVIFETPEAEAKLISELTIVFQNSTIVE